MKDSGGKVQKKVRPNMVIAPVGASDLSSVAYQADLWSKLGYKKAHLTGDSGLDRATLLQLFSSSQDLCFIGHGMFDEHQPAYSFLRIDNVTAYAWELVAVTELRTANLTSCYTGRAGPDGIGIANMVLLAGAQSVVACLFEVPEWTNALFNRLLVCEQERSQEYFLTEQKFYNALGRFRFSTMRTLFSLIEENAPRKQAKRIVQEYHVHVCSDPDSQINDFPWLWSGYVWLEAPT